MKVKPVITNRYQSNYLNMKLDLELDTNLILISGDAVSGKSFVWQMFDNDRALNFDVETLNYKDLKDADEKITGYKNKLVVIDNADILLNEELRKHIAFDTTNQYILMGRNPEYLYLTKENCKELIIENDVIRIGDMLSV